MTKNTVPSGSTPPLIRIAFLSPSEASASPYSSGDKTSASGYILTLMPCLAAFAFTSAKNFLASATSISPVGSLSPIENSGGLFVLILMPCLDGIPIWSRIWSGVNFLSKPIVGPALVFAFGRFCRGVAASSSNMSGSVRLKRTLRSKARKSSAASIASARSSPSFASFSAFLFFLI